MIEAKLSEHNWLPHLQAVAEINLESASTMWRLNLASGTLLDNNWHSMKDSVDSNDGRLLVAEV